MTEKSKIRNFSIIAHIDHGKSTLADRMLEVTGTIDKREMKDQVLDSMDLERERGITIKMQPVTMKFETGYQQYSFNLIDTPGHIDFSYEVSRALRAVEGALLLVDASQGLQAQTFSTLESAKSAGVKIIPVLSKIDSPLARLDDVKMEIIELLGCEFDEILETSGKTGLGVNTLLEHIVTMVPAPEENQLYEPENQNLRALIFDFEYSEHRGVIIYVRVFGGSISAKQNLSFAVSGKNFVVQEVGIFNPTKSPKEKLDVGEIGYIVTGIKQAGLASVGDTVIQAGSKTIGLPGYEVPAPVIWASVYPPSQDSFFQLSLSLSRLKLSDASLQYEEEVSGILGRGFRMGFLGMLHLEIVVERLKREFNLELILTSPSVPFEVVDRKNTKTMIYTPAQFPGHGDIISVEEPWAEIEVIVPSSFYQNLIPLFADFEVTLIDSMSFGDKRSRIHAIMPLRELMRNFFDELKSVSSGYASFSYKQVGYKPADVIKMEVLVADEIVPAMTKIVPRYRLERESQELVERLEKLMPKQMFAYKVQAQALGRIWASRSIKAFRKDVTAKLYGGDITRKMKLREKQKEGKKKMADSGKVNIPQDVFVKMIKNSDN